MTEKQIRAALDAAADEYWKDGHPDGYTILEAYLEWISPDELIVALAKHLPAPTPPNQ